MVSGEKLIGNSLFLFTDWVAITFLSLFYWFIIGKTLPPESYGIISASVNLMIIISGFTLVGMQLAVPKLISEYVEERKNEKSKNLIAFSLRLIITLGAITSVSIALLSGYLTKLLNLPFEALMIISFSIIVWSLWSFSTSILLGLQNMKYIFKTNLIGNVIKVALTFLLIILGFNYLGPLISVVTGLIFIVLLRHKILYIRQGSNNINKRNVIVNYALPAFITGITMLFFGSTPSIILNAIKGAAITGLFAISITISSPLSMVPSTLTQALFPIISALSTEANPKKRQMNLIKIVTRYAFFMTIPAFVILILFSQNILILFARQEYLPATSLLPIIAFATIILGIGGIFNSNIYAMRKPKVSRNIVIITATLFLLLALPLTYIFSATGMATAYLLSILLFTLLSYLYLRKNIRLRFSGAMFMKLVTANIVLGLILYSTKLFNNLLIKILLFAFGILSYFVALLLVKYYSKEDARVLNMVAEKTPVLKKQFYALSKFISKHS